MVTKRTNINFSTFSYLTIYVHFALCLMCPFYSRTMKYKNVYVKVL